MRRRRLSAALAVAAALGAGLAIAGCGGSANELSVVEGEPLDVGDLQYNVSISRELNAADPEDRAYLQGQKPLPNDKFWFGVFMQVHNTAGISEALPTDMTITDTQGNTYHPIPTRSVFALKLGAQVPPDGTLPEAESPAASGPIEGGLVLFQIANVSTENRPLVLRVPSSAPGGETGQVELDL
jgi:hypothetical protein